MSAACCAREPDVLALVAIGQWPRQADDALVAHVAACGACADALIVALAMRETIDEAPPAAVPDAAAVWQRAQWRARQEAMRVASRPVLAAQAVVVAGVIATLALVSLWLADRLPGRRVVAGAVVARGSLLVAPLRDAWASMVGALEPSASAIWTVSALVAVPLLVVGLALLLSTIADLASDRPAR